MKQSIVNTLGAFGYISLILQWGWAIVILGLPLISTETFQNIFLPTQTQSTISAETTSATTIPQPIEVGIIVTSIFFAVVISIYALISVPRAIGARGKKATNVVATKIAPVITRHKVLPKKQQKKLIEYLGWSIKITLAIIPFLLVLIPVDTTLELTREVTISAAILLFSATLAWFVCQYLLARLWKVPASRVW